MNDNIQNIQTESIAVEPPVIEMSDNDFADVLNQYGIDSNATEDAGNVSQHVTHENNAIGNDADYLIHTAPRNSEQNNQRIVDAEIIEDDYEDSIEQTDNLEDMLNTSLLNQSNNSTVSNNFRGYHSASTNSGRLTQHTAERFQQVTEEIERTITHTNQVQSPSKKTTKDIESNSLTMLFNDNTARFSGTDWYEEVKKQKILIAGLGGIGSFTMFMLSRLQPNMIIAYDDDIVEGVNMSGQLYGNRSVGRYKTENIVNFIKEYSNYNSVITSSHRFDETTSANNIMICGFDNMAARLTFFKSWVLYLKTLSLEQRKDCLFIDGRMSINEIQVFAFTGDDTYNINRYKNEYLFEDSESESEVCSMKQTTYVASMIGSIIANLFVNFIGRKVNNYLPIYDLPFRTYYDANLMFFKTEL